MFCPIQPHRAISALVPDNATRDVKKGDGYQTLWITDAYHDQLARALSASAVLIEQGELGVSQVKVIGVTSEYHVWNPLVCCVPSIRLSLLLVLIQRR